MEENNVSLEKQLEELKKHNKLLKCELGGHKDMLSDSLQQNLNLRIQIHSIIDENTQLKSQLKG